MAKYETSAKPRAWREMLIYTGLRKRGLRPGPCRLGMIVFSNHDRVLAVVGTVSRFKWSGLQVQTEFRAFLSLGVPCYLWSRKWGLRLVVDSKFPVRRCDALEAIFAKTMFKRSLLLRRRDPLAYKEEMEANRLERRLFGDGKD